MAASTSTGTNNNYSYDVFISVRGSDLGKTIASLLYRRLFDNGLQVFLDLEGLKLGNELAIRTASLHVVIFSPRYAESSSCLNELLLMLESGAPLVPVFYHVRPTDLRWTQPEGVFARSLHILERKRTYDSKPCYDSTTIEKWRNALSQVADISGLDLQAFNGDEGLLVDNIVAALRSWKPQAWSVGRDEMASDLKLKVLLEKGLLSVHQGESAEVPDTKNSVASHLCDVFISHRGPDTKNSVASHLYLRLVGNGLRVFLQGKDLQPRDELNLFPRMGFGVLNRLARNRALVQIKTAIKTAMVHVAIFSPTDADSKWCLADSKWCLDELLLMLESGAPIIPVFYGVTRDQGFYAQSLQNLERERTYDSKPRYDSTTIEKWRNALSQVAGISGFNLEASNGDKDELAGKVVESVLRTVRRVKFTAKYVVGLDEKVEDFENKVLFEDNQSAKPQVVGIVGVGGVGKTTLAKELWNSKRAHYSKSCFLSNVRENARLGLLNSLQRQLLKSLTETDAPIIISIDEGKKALKKHLPSCRVFMILDDVDHLNQIDALLPVQTNLLSDSLIVITSRDEGVIRSSGVENASIYQLTGLNHQHSRELFCAYAFNQPYPHPGFENLVHKFLKACEGLPLRLRVLGALLHGNHDPSDWREQLHRLQNVLPSETQEILQIGYDSLDREAKQMFLDTACFFIGQKRDTAIRIWEGSLWEAHSGFHTLQRRCLLGVDDENNIEMHDHLRDFGRAVARTSSPGRLMHYTDMLEQLSGNKQVTAVRGIRIVPEDNVDVNDLDVILEVAYAFGRRIDTSTLELLDTENAILERILRRPMHVSRSLIWLRWNKCPNRFLPSWIPMDSLRVLQVSGSVLKTLWEDDSQPPLLLRELEINAPLSNIPGSIGRLKHLERFVVGKYLSGQVNLTELPVEFCHLQSLKALVLTECSKIKSLPEFGALLMWLQHIDLSFCRNLERLPDSLDYLSHLRLINLSDCHDLVALPDKIGRLRCLQHIDLQGCHNLERLPDSFGDLTSLRHINLSSCHDLHRLPDSFGKLRYLQHIDLHGCHSLEGLPISFGYLMNPEYINLSNCHNLERLPESIGNLSNLLHMDLSGCHNLERLPNNFRKLRKLKYLDVEGCSNLIIDRFEIIEISGNLPLPHRSQLEQLYE